MKPIMIFNQLRRTETLRRPQMNLDSGDCGQKGLGVMSTGYRQS